MILGDFDDPGDRLKDTPMLFFRFFCLLLLVNISIIFFISVLMGVKIHIINITNITSHIIKTKIIVKQTIKSKMY